MDRRLMLFQKMDISVGSMTQGKDTPPTTVLSHSHHVTASHSEENHPHTPHPNTVENLTVTSVSPGRTEDSRNGSSSKIGEPPAVRCRSGAAVSVKEETKDDEEDEIIIDLTPRPDIVPQPRDAASARGPTGRGLSYPHSFTSASSHVGEDAFSPAGNIPSHLQLPDDGYSDSETSYQDGPNKNAANKNEVVSGLFRFSVHKDSMVPLTQPRAKREFVPENRKDQTYWNKRHKNNISARRSRMKRKTIEQLMERRMLELEQENIKLKYELKAMKRLYGGEQTNTDETPSPSGSPLSTSSGLGMSNSNLSSAGSAEHSTSSSPLLNVEEDKTQKTSSQTKPVHIQKEYEVLRDASECVDNRSQRYPPVSEISPPPAHSQSHSPPALYLNVPNHKTFNNNPRPPAAHGSYGNGPLSFTENSFINGCGRWDRPVTVADVAVWQEEFDKLYGSTCLPVHLGNPVPPTPLLPTHGDSVVPPSHHLPRHGDSHVPSNSLHPTYRDSVPSNSFHPCQPDSGLSNPMRPSQSHGNSASPNFLLSSQSHGEPVSPGSQAPPQLHNYSVPPSYWSNPDAELNAESSTGVSPAKKRSFCDVDEESLQKFRGVPLKWRFKQSAQNQTNARKDSSPQQSSPQSCEG